MQKYYGLVISENTLKKLNPTGREVDVAIYTMKRNIIAALNHSVVHHDSAKQHRFCPAEKDSWWKWQQQKVTMGTATYRDYDSLPEVFLELLKPTVMALSDSKRLERCICGNIQDPNECLNSLVLVRCPKHKHHGVKVVHFATASAV